MSGRQQSLIQILKMPIEELFIIREIKPEIPVKAKIFTSVKCALCGEMVVEKWARVRNGTFVCMPCAGGTAEGGERYSYTKNEVCRSRGQ